MVWRKVGTGAFRAGQPVVLREHTVGETICVSASGRCAGHTVEGTRAEKPSAWQPSRTQAPHPRARP